MATGDAHVGVIRPGAEGSAPGRSEIASFYFDLGSPVAYLAAERAVSVLPAAVDWRPVLARELPGGEGFEGLPGGEDVEGFGCRGNEPAFRAEIERAAARQGVQPLVWPDEFPFDSELAMRVAVYARGLGKVAAFALAAFRQAFAGGRSLAEEDNVLIAAAACEMHPRAVLVGARSRGVAERLQAETAEAARAGITDVPAVALGGVVHVGADSLERAAASAGGGGAKGVEGVAAAAAGIEGTEGAERTAVASEAAGDTPAP
jgi:2-hydroxychromene-2-carboxylate isomerase